MFYMISFIVIAVMLAVSTLLSLSHMRKVFSKESMKEEGAIKCMLLLFCGTYMIRVAFAVLFHIKYEWVYTLFNDYNNYFGLAVLCLWTSWDAVPLVSMLVTHCKNFSSFKDHKFEEPPNGAFEGYNYLDSYYSLDPNAEGDDQNDAISHQRYSGLMETSSILQIDSEGEEEEENSSDEDD